MPYWWWQGRPSPVGPFRKNMETETIAYFIETDGISYFNDHLQWVNLTVTTDICFQVLNALLLSGMIGTQHFWLERVQTACRSFRLWFGLEPYRISGQDQTWCEGLHRPAFRGSIVQSGTLPVQAAMEETSTCSLACVFSDRYGIRSRATCEDAWLNQRSVGATWFMVYHPASAYLSVVDVKDLELKQGETEATVLAFKEKDAKAMGQCLLIKRCQTELEWQIEPCWGSRSCWGNFVTKNKGRAPWGCMWFEAWRQKVEEAVQLNQKVATFFTSKINVAEGKLAWKQLCDTRAKEIARKDTGLGASQTAEVAYLEKEGIPFEEHDITAFTEFDCPKLVCHKWRCQKKELKKIRPYESTVNHIRGFAGFPTYCRPAWVVKLVASTVEGFFLLVMGCIQSMGAEANAPKHPLSNFSVTCFV